MSPKIFLTAIICFAVGAGAVFAWQHYSAVLSENETLKNAKVQISPLPSATPETTSDMNKKSAPPIPAQSVSPEPVAAGSISGSLGYPSEHIPAMDVYAFKQNQLSSYHKISTADSQGSYTISGLEPDTYVLVAYLKSGGLSGGYTKMVPCGLLASCTDHSLIGVTVKAGETTTGADIKDWYAPSGAFPSKP